MGKRCFCLAVGVIPFLTCMAWLHLFPLISECLQIDGEFCCLCPTFIIYMPWFAQGLENFKTTFFLFSFNFTLIWMTSLLKRLHGYALA